MIESDVVRASPAKLREWAKFYGLRQKNEASPWHVRKSVRHPATGKDHQFKYSTRTVDLRTALMRAVPMVEDFMARIQTDLCAPARSVARSTSLAILRDAYFSAPTVRASKKTRTRNWNDFFRIVRSVHGQDLRPESAQVGLVTRDLAKAYQRRRLDEIMAEHGGDLLKIEASKRACNSTLKNAQSVFSRAALEDYEGMRLPDTVKDFAAAFPVAARDQEEPVALDDAFVARLLGAPAEALRRDDPAVWVLFSLMIWGGLRNIDASNARRSWMQFEADGCRIKLVPTANYTPKGSSGSVIIPKDVAEAILSVRAPDGAVVDVDPYLIPASCKAERVSYVSRRLNDWLSAQGVEREAVKVSYRLRKYFLAKVADQQGREMAQIAGRHADMATTEGSYIGKPRMVKPIAL